MDPRSPLARLVVGRTYTILRDMPEESFAARMLALASLENGRTVAVLETIPGSEITDPDTGRSTRFERVSVSPRYSAEDMASLPTIFPMPVNLVALKDDIDLSRIGTDDYVDLGRSTIEPNGGWP